MRRLLLVGIIVALFDTIYFCLFKDNPGVRWWSSPLVTGIMLVFYALFERVKNFEAFKFAFFPFLYLCVGIDFFVNGGFRSIFPLDMAILFLFTSCMFEKKWMYSFLLADTGLLILCVGVHFYFPAWAPDVRSSQLSVLEVLEVLSRIFTIACFGWVLKAEYDRKMSQVIQLNRQLEEKNDEIILHREEVLAANEQLVDRVNERTEKLRYVNKQLSEYAFFNSHKVRGPLARIIGINNLIHMHYQKNELAKDPELDKYLAYLDKSTAELDTVIAVINEILKKEKLTLD
ncbi:MAG: hypothetical protein K2Q22_07110 [Cytophagales bacterium]|nr:hypothetical protein [Cytophagales bacterium]